MRANLTAAALVVALTSPLVVKAQEKSADEVARELANPNSPLASLTFKNQFRWYDGSLPGADDQHNYTLLFQPVFPFDLGKTDSGGSATLFVRPAFPLLVDQPVFDPATMRFDGSTGLGDIGFDIGYGVTEPNGILWALGMVGTLPTATDDDLGGEQLRLGPEVLLAKLEDWGLYGIFPSHQWNIAGDGTQYSVSQVQLFLSFLPGNGWKVGTTPIINYNWVSDEWTVPLNLSVSKTVKWGNTPVNLGAEINYYIEKPNAFGPEWMVSFNITPVVPNVLADLFQRK
jgi:hypothetical protein